jgi:hypothetical protein
VCLSKEEGLYITKTRKIIFQKRKTDKRVLYIHTHTYTRKVAKGVGASIKYLVNTGDTTTQCVPRILFLRTAASWHWKQYPPGVPVISSAETVTLKWHSVYSLEITAVSSDIFISLLQLYLPVCCILFTNFSSLIQIHCVSKKEKDVQLCRIKRKIYLKSTAKKDKNIQCAARNYRLQNTATDQCCISRPLYLCVCF